MRKGARTKRGCITSVGQGLMAAVVAFVPKHGVTLF